MNIKTLKIMLHTVIWAGLAITLWVVHKNTGNSFSVRFVVAYMGFLALYVVFSLIMKVTQMRHLSRAQVRKVLMRFSKTFAFTFLVLIIGDALRMPSDLNLGGVVRLLCMAISISFGMVTIRKDVTHS